MLEMMNSKALSLFRDHRRALQHHQKEVLQPHSERALLRWYLPQLVISKCDL